MFRSFPAYVYRNELTSRFASLLSPKCIAIGAAAPLVTAPHPGKDYTYMHACTQLHTHTYMHACTQQHTQQTHTQTQTHLLPHSHKNTQIPHLFTLSSFPVSMHTYVCVLVVGIAWTCRVRSVAQSTRLADDSYVRCKSRKHKAYIREMRGQKNCPLCHSPWPKVATGGSVMTSSSSGVTGGGVGATSAAIQSLVAGV